MHRLSILPARFGNHGAQLGERDRTQERVQTANNPNTHEQPGVRYLLSDCTRSTKYSRANGVADNNSQAKAYAQHTQQASAIVDD